MPWNWERPDWPHFTWNQSRLALAEKEFLVASGMFLGALKHLDDDDRNQLTVEAMSTEALITSEIEGEILNRASVQSSIQRQLGLPTDNRRVGRAERGISEMMINLYKTFAAPVTQDTLFEWQRMLTSGRTDLSDIGRYRTSSESTQVISGPVGSPRIHFEAPPAVKVPAEMDRFIVWFNTTTPGGAAPLAALARAGAAHLYFECIHPFEDGNGRIGRALAEKSLAQSLGQPSLIALAATILSRRAHYYSSLQAANKANEITDWLACRLCQILFEQTSPSTPASGLPCSLASRSTTTARP
jgi:Fic family protein